MNQDLNNGDELHHDLSIRVTKEQYEDAKGIVREYEEERDKQTANHIIAFSIKIEENKKNKFYSYE